MQFEAFLKSARRPDVETLLACRRDDGSIAGVFRLSQIFRQNFQSAYLGFYAMAPSAGRGYMAEGLQLVLRHAFLNLKLHRVEANVQPANHPSKRLVRRAGFRYEGFSSRYLKIGRRWRDHERWAMTVEDWRDLCQAGRQKGFSSVALFKAAGSLAE
jgi:ribosomal-protein-alanine N-acetyltransferase